MNTSNLKSYASQARKDFIAAVTARANLLGLSEAKSQLVVAEAKTSGDLVMIAGRPWPVKVNEQRNKLIARMRQQGFGHTVEAVAYAWFNRLAALRFMELHDYLGHGRRVLSNPQGGLPEVLAYALDLAESNALPGLSIDTVRQLKLANQDPELYRLVLIAQCNALHQAMPFLFEQVGEETELLLSENLLLTDSVVAKLVQSIPEGDWQQIEIIGWLYQFYISEKKDQVIGKVVKSEDIPAATQLFTPNWMVKYMVQNSLGAQWLATYPDSPLKAQMEYYIEPAKQTDEVNAQLAAITPGVLNPEELTLIDPACGSGHILVEAYDLFNAIYLERGYRQRDVARLILEKNLFGLDIDERAAQLTGFALMMKGRAGDRHLFERAVNINVMALVDSATFDAEVVAKGTQLANYGLTLEDLTLLKRLFEHATTLGTLLQVPPRLVVRLPALKKLSGMASDDMFLSAALKQLVPLVKQAELLAARYDSMAANPPYMGSKGMNGVVKRFVTDSFPDAKSDLFACFIERGYTLAKDAGRIAMVTMQSWMFLSSFERMRERLLRDRSVCTLAHLGARAFGSISGEIVQTTAFVLRNLPSHGFKPVFFRLLEGGEVEKRLTLAAGNSRFENVTQDQFSAVSGSPLAYWLGPATLQAFASGICVGDIAAARIGMATGQNDRYVRQWSEVSVDAIVLDAETRQEAEASGCRWFPYAKGGEFRRWYGNHSNIVNWQDDGKELQTTLHPDGGRIWAHNFNLDNIFKRNLSWTFVTSAPPSFRLQTKGFLFDSASGLCHVFEGAKVNDVLAWLNSKPVMAWLPALNPTLNLPPGTIQALPFPGADVSETTDWLIKTAKTDWDSYERSWDFQAPPLLTAFPTRSSTIEASYNAWISVNRATVAKMRSVEEGHNRKYIAAYGLNDEISPEVSVEQITITVNPAYRYGGKINDEERCARFCQDTMAELVSYALGCMMGRYSLDEPGLIYAHSGNAGFNPLRYAKFPADADGIVPITDELWFEDDAALRIREFVLAVWGAASLEQNLAWLADAFRRKANESPEEAIRRYLADRFFNDHLQAYKKRPIYWLFSSGRQGAFQALVYLHRYNAGTLSRLRAEYVIPLTGKMHGRIEQLERDVATASSTATRNRANKQLEGLRKKHMELLAYDERLRHYADQRIELDLDDGVKANYGKFGDLLAEVKAVSGKQDEE